MINNINHKKQYNMLKVKDNSGHDKDYTFNHLLQSENPTTKELLEFIQLEVKTQSSFYKLLNSIILLLSQDLISDKSVIGMLADYSAKQEVVQSNTNRLLNMVKNDLIKLRNAS
jgi:hypothetical protein